MSTEGHRRVEARHVVLLAVVLATLTADVYAYNYFESTLTDIPQTLMFFSCVALGNGAVIGSTFLFTRPGEPEPVPSTQKPRRKKGSLGDHDDVNRLG